MRRKSKIFKHNDVVRDYAELGRKLDEIKTQFIESGKTDLFYSLERLTSGIYFIRYKINDQIETYKFNH